MLRILRILIVAVVALLLRSPAWAEESADVQQIRNLFSTIWADEDKGDPASTIAVTAPDAVFYDASGGGPELWTVAVVGLDAFRKMVEPVIKESAPGGTWAKHPNWSQGAEVLHVDVKDDRAIVLTQKWSVQPDSTAREDIYTKYQEVVMLAKIKGEWKITNGITLNYTRIAYKFDPK